MGNRLCTALKEWSAAISALEAGETIVLLRKGGIREVGGQFQVSCDRVLLYPTYEHQRTELLKPAYRCNVEMTAPGWHPDTIPIGAWAHITNVLEVTEQAALDALLPLHIWNDLFAAERFRWKPRSPLYVLLLRVFRLAKPVAIPYRETYGGCRSWIELEQTIDLTGSEAVMTDRNYAAQVQEVYRRVGQEIQPNASQATMD
ncbi:DUF1802 family protein [Alkalinema sp. FACHB-956]|uniref:DUF1802 family protein n=1 Tax=Alkalinema sp. FACHB-956 TaxID=2692768 RepID=UPI0016842F18|nr:DUF1802 family protein [Alkalinema sp. FACHB-956]MBD2329790.1 DUF1802 family protein [Alkalinema sp. FACHB-956]